MRILTPVRYPRFRPPIEVQYVPDAYEDSDSGLNAKEAEAVIEEIDRILVDPKLEGLSLGAVSPFRPQADLIYALMQERFADRWRECERRGLTASTADGFQGDERDVILYSMRHAPGSHPGSITGIEANQGARRLNVAFTRARRKVIIFCSLPGDRFPGRYISSFLKHALTVQASYRDPLMTASEEDHFDSEFEREVCQRLRAQGLRVTTQFPVASYRIDLVVEDNEGRRLGVECDGPFHYDELGQLREEDYERQEIIERGGWAIYRIPSRRFYLDPQREIALVAHVLHEQVTDAESVVKNFEDFSRISPQLEEEIHAQPAGEPEIEHITESLGKRGAFENWFEPPFDLSEPWLKAAHWGNFTGKLNYSNRIFLWQIGDKIRKQQNLEDAEKIRARNIWHLISKEGFRPFAEGEEAS